MPKTMMRATGVWARQRGFFDFSMPELGIIFVVALVVLGPKKLPPLVQQIGRWVGRARHMARQFRDQLEQEVNSINAVKPVPRHVTPEVGPAAPGTPPAPDIEPAATGTADMGVVEETTTAAAPSAETPAVAEAPGSDVHPEAQMYFAMNGSEPAVVAHDPYAPQSAPPAAALDAPAAEQPPSGAAREPGSHGEPEAGHGAAAAAKTDDPGQPATVEVLFPHDHG
jgi:sec-independent protein translocase protein TatB